MTTNDILFIQKLQIISNYNKENPNSRKSVKTVSGLLSDELLKVFNVKREHQGGWFFNVYVEFQPMFIEQEAKDWQK